MRTLNHYLCAYCIDGGSSAAVLSVQSTVEAADSFLVLNPTHTHNDPYHGCMQYSLSPVALSPSSITPSLPITLLSSALLYFTVTVFTGLHCKLLGQDTLLCSSLLSAVDATQLVNDDRVMIDSAGVIATDRALVTQGLVMEDLSLVHLCNQVL